MLFDHVTFDLSPWESLSSSLSFVYGFARASYQRQVSDREAWIQPDPEMRILFPPCDHSARLSAAPRPAAPRSLCLGRCISGLLKCLLHETSVMQFWKLPDHIFSSWLIRREDCSLTYGMTISSPFRVCSPGGKIRCTRRAV